MGQARCWTSEELELLKMLWGERTIPQIAKRLKRSVNGIKVKAYRIGLGGQTESGGLMPARKVAELMGVDLHTVTDYWIPTLGLKAKKEVMFTERKYTLIKFDDLIVFLKAHPDVWDSRRVDFYAFGEEPEWLTKKREADKQIPKRKFQLWTQFEDAQAINMFKKGLTYAEIGKELNRSASSVEHRIHRLDVWGSGRYIPEAERNALKEQKKKRALIANLLGVLKYKFNQLNFDGYFQKDMCMHWDDVRGCTKRQSSCDECTEFERIRPQYCVRCGGTFFERKQNKICASCRLARAQQARKKWAIMNRS